MAENVGSEFIEIAQLCGEIVAKKLLNTTLHDTPNITDVLSEKLHKPKQTSILDKLIHDGLTASNQTHKVNVTMEVILREFESFTEWYLITMVAAVGIASNLAVMALLGRDKAMRRRSYLLHMLLLAMETLYVVMVIIFIQFRHFSNVNPLRQLEHMSLITMTMSFAQCTAIWLLYVVATDAYRAVRIHMKPAKILQLRHANKNVALIFIGTLLFYVPYVPEFRVLIYRWDPTGFNPCNIPVEDHWDFKTPSGDYDLYYILYYSLLYSLVLYWVPFLMLGARDKDLIDLLHSVMDYSSYKDPDVIHNCYTAKVVSIFCNVNLFCVTPKLVLLLFQLVDYAVRFMSRAQIFFEFFNVMANLLLVIRSSSYLFMFLLFHPRVKMIICMACCYRCLLRRHKHTMSKSSPVPVVTVTEPENSD